MEPGIQRKSSAAGGNIYHDAFRELFAGFRTPFRWRSTVPE
jgi:hypothetical protein